MKKDEQTNINPEMIDKISILAQLSLTEEEKLLAGEDMVRMLDFFALLSAWDDGFEDTEGLTGSDRSEEIHAASRNILRRDKVTNQEDDGGLLTNAPAQKDGAVYQRTTA
ncbi:MAG: Asp-tRNA(Asn)/Glu-tRNA(Gln) amidotransferase GatCAB subunit C [Lachnospiraceae bacterium]|nr:Asp-tRNA(Asn)/Glu-tRNA(Gln) amidotransferase GatCAB subunit C [Lachnospiraceae bacterium]